MIQTQWIGGVYPPARKRQPPGVCGPANLERHRLARKAAVEAETLELLRKHGEMTTGQVAAYRGKVNGTVFAQLTRLMAEGRVTRKQSTKVHNGVPLQVWSVK